MTIAPLLRMLRRQCRLVPVLSAVILISAGLWTFLSSSAGSRCSGDRWERPVPIGHRIRTAGCTLPLYDPFDPTVKPFIRLRFERAKCPGKPNFLTIRSGFPAILSQKLEEHGVLPEELTCFYREIYRNDSLNVPDKVYLFGPRTTLSFDKALKEEFVFVECVTKKSPERPFHKQLLLNALLKKNVEKRCRRVRKGTPHNLSVLILGLDAVSHLNFDRHLPETAKFVREKLGAFELHGYNKVGEKSYPNHMGFLTGLKNFEADKAAQAGFYDNLSPSLIWRKYAARGYRTMFLEEWPQYSLFSSIPFKGFRRAPVDYYLRHVIMLMDDLTKNTEEELRVSCLGPTMPSEVLLDYLANFLNVMSERPFFAYAWFSELTHEWLNNAAYVDEPVRRLLEDVHASGVLNHTVLVFCSDHGLRFGKVRTTYIGRLEDIQPFGFLVFPQWFLDKNPEAARSLHVNQRRLTTPFDLHATLAELLDYPVLKRPRTSYGLSLFHEIPGERTCSDASIQPQWCACSVRDAGAVSGALARALADRLVAHVNGALARASRNCAVYRLLRVMDVTSLQATPAELEKNTSDYFIVVKLSPGNVVFEGLVRVNGDYSIELKHISRCDKYKKLEEHGVLPEELTCFYREIYRNDSLNVPDRVYLFGPRTTLSFDKALKEEFVFVEWCHEEVPGEAFSQTVSSEPAYQEERREALRTGTKSYAP
ncbi:uncharacterized protein LOC125945003 [Dermacentor silvarum]|uniref:uncharacterized protein LOC125945003 n=1 Tax=Dermacentor silvarum TaxID=543639 RepID=UPI0021016652|nr:uncharacterized protein LOC125945003 [Dermacentor silvarum]